MNHRITTFLLCALMTLVIVSCKKDKDEDSAIHGTTGPQGTFAEGVYKPTYRIVSIKESGEVVQSWSWGTSKLASVVNTKDNITSSFTYSGDMLGGVSISGENSNQDIVYTYGGSLVTQMKISHNLQDDVVMNIQHDANDRLAAVDLVLSNDYAIQMCIGVVNFKSALGRLVGKETFEAMTEMLSLMNLKKNAGKLDISNKHFSITYTWEGSNIVKESLRGNVQATATISEVAEAFNFGSISNLLSYISNDPFPLESSIQRDIVYTYDNNPNPIWYYWGEGIAVENLSRNNIVTATTTGTLENQITITFPDAIPIVGGTSREFPRSTDLAASVTHTYTYNNNGYPTTVTTNGVAKNYAYSN